jgi:hypothetical protein
MSEITPNTPNPVREDAYKQQLATKLGIDPKYIPGSPIWHSEEEIAAIAEMFANMSGGGSSGGGVLYVTSSKDTMTLSKNLEEIQAALDGGKVVMLKRESPSDGVFYAPLFKTVSLPEDPYYGVAFYDFYYTQNVVFSNTTSPTDPLVYEE